MAIKEKDEYNWAEYTSEYAAQLETIAEKENDLFVNEVSFKESDVVFKDNIHPNWKEIYSTVVRLNPKSVYEVGCGCGMHLMNIKKMMPHIEVGGCELLPSQVQLGITKYNLPNSIFRNIDFVDFTNTGNVKIFASPAEFVYSHAVCMHLSSEHAKSFLKNMSIIAEKYILLVEGVNNHENWYDMVKECLPEFEFELTSKYIDYGILLTRK